MHLQMPSVESRKGQLQKDTPSSTHRPALAAPRRAEAAWRLKPREAVPTSLSKVRIWASSGASPGVKLLFPSKTPCGWLPLRVPQLSCWGVLWVYYDNLIHSLSWWVSLSYSLSKQKVQPPTVEVHVEQNPIPHLQWEKPKIIAACQPSHGASLGWKMGLSQ